MELIQVSTPQIYYKGLFGCGSARIPIYCPTAMVYKILLNRFSNGFDVL